MTVTTFDIAKDSTGTWSALTWVLQDKVDDSDIGTVVESDLDDRCGELWGNNVCKALTQINQVFQGTLEPDALSVGGNVTLNSASPTLLVGDGTGSPDVTLDKSETGDAWSLYHNAGVLRWRAGIATDENYDVGRFNSSGVFQDTPISINQSTGLTALDKDVTVAGSFDITEPDARATFGDGTSTPILALDGQLSGDKRIDFNTAGVNNWIFKQLATSRDLEIGRRDSGGSGVDIPFTIAWADGGVTVGASSGRVGFFGTTPAVIASAYTPTNVVTDRSYDANSTTTAELADVLGTLIADLQTYGLLQ